MTMYIEELVERISTVGNYLFSPPIATSSVHQSLFYSFSEQMITYGLTEKQKNYVYLFYKNMSKSFQMILTLMQILF